MDENPKLKQDRMAPTVAFVTLKVDVVQSLSKFDCHKGKYCKVTKGYDLMSEHNISINPIPDESATGSAWHADTNLANHKASACSHFQSLLGHSITIRSS
eukprot:1158565-Pelagomonas_calceolata.AAC.5